MSILSDLQGYMPSLDLTVCIPAMFPLESRLLDLSLLLLLPIGGSAAVACLSAAAGHVNAAIDSGVYRWQIKCQILLTALAQIPKYHTGVLR